MAVSVSLACDQGSIPVAWQLYLPEDWAQDAERRKRAGVPESVRFATKTQIALKQLHNLLSEGAPRHCVLADAGYGVDTAFRHGFNALACQRQHQTRAIALEPRMAIRVSKPLR